MVKIFQAAAKPRKYRNVPTVVDGVRFDSKKEALRYVELKLLERAGEIKVLKLQPRFKLRSEDGTVICEYRADFGYWDVAAKKPVTEDVKSPPTRKNPVYRIKKKWFEADYGREIKET